MASKLRPQFCVAAAGIIVNKPYLNSEYPLCVPQVPQGFLSVPYIVWPATNFPVEHANPETKSADVNPLYAIFGSVTQYELLTIASLYTVV